MFHPAVTAGPSRRGVRSAARARVSSIAFALLASTRRIKGQLFGTKPGRPLADKVFGRAVRLEVTGVDRNHREVGRILLGERFVNMELTPPWIYL
jgi:hypothetical protein